MCSGAFLPTSCDPLAMVYSGHQFGSYNPQLGDGRGLLLGEVRNTSGESWDLHLKGAGLTPYSRFGDGRAVLGSCVREYLASEALHHLGIPTTRALCVVTSDTPVYREQEERGTTLLRIAKTHIRFGHFEYFFHTRQHDQLKVLADYCIHNYFPQLTSLEQEEQYGQLLETIIRKTALLIARWQASGFAHGVMNTDNMSILGETFDYGPFSFQDAFDWHYICNHSDHTGRYAFSQQPDIGYWNCGRLAQSLLPLVNTPDTLQKALDTYPKAYADNYLTLMRKKLGLRQERPEDRELVQDIIKFLHEEHRDYTLFFRHLSFYTDNKNFSNTTNNNTYHFPSCSETFKKLVNQYKHRLSYEIKHDDKGINEILKINPKFILRNHLAHTAIKKAEQGDYSDIEHLMTVLQKPYDEHHEFEAFSDVPPAWSKTLTVSCSS